MLYLEQIIAKTRGHKVIYVSGQGHLVLNYPSRSSKVTQGHARGHQNLKLPSNSEVNESLVFNIGVSQVWNTDRAINALLPRNLF